MQPSSQPPFLNSAMPSIKRSIAEANGGGTNEFPAGDEHRRATTPRRQVSNDEPKPAKPPSASDGAPVGASSLLMLGRDSLSYLVRFFDIASLARFEGVCQHFRQMAAQRWEALDAQIPAKGRSKAESPRLRVIRHHMAATASMVIEPMIAEDSAYDEDANSRCQFPGSEYNLDTDLVGGKNLNHNPSNYEFFCRFVQKSSGNLLAQGFCTAEPSSFNFKSRIFFFKDMDLSSWSVMKDLVEDLEGSSTLGLPELRVALEKVMEDLSMTVVAISKESVPEIRVISAVNKMEDRTSCGMKGRQKWHSREMKTILIHPHGNPYFRRISTRFKVGDRYEKECDENVVLQIETNTH